MLCHTHAVFLDEIHFKNHMNTIVQGYRGVYCKHQINKILYDPQKKSEMKQKCDTVTHVIHKMECFIIANAAVENKNNCTK